MWSGIATVAFVTGSVLLYDGLSLSWVTLLVAIVGMSLAMLAGMPAMVRVRFSTPTIGREWMVGEVGSARTEVDPDGVVLVRDAPWRARTSRVTPIAAGEPMRVVSIDGLLLEVEPIEPRTDRSTAAPDRDPIDAIWRVVPPVHLAAERPGNQACTPPDLRLDPRYPG